VFGLVASDSTCWLVLGAVVDDDLAAVEVARGGRVGAVDRGHRNGIATLVGGQGAPAGPRRPGGAGGRRQATR
jgi:hypothetical protein